MTAQPIGRAVGKRPAVGLAWRWGAALLLVAAIAAGSAAAFGALRRVGATLDDTHRARRVLTYEASGARAVTWHVEAGTDVLRFFAYRAASSPANDPANPAKLLVKVTAADGAREITVALDPPTATPRATVDATGEPLLGPSPFNLDLRGLTPCDVTLRVDAQTSGERWLLRAWARSPSEPGSAESTPLPSKTHGARLARAVGELGWSDLSLEEKRALARRRWERLAPPPTSDGDVEPVAVTIAPPDESDPRPRRAKPTTRLRAGDELRARVEGPLRVTIDGSAAAPLTADLSNEAGPPQRVEGPLPLELDVPAGATQELSVRSAGDAALRVSASGAGHLDLGAWVSCFRASPSRPAQLEPLGEPIVLEITARAPVAPGERADVALRLDAVLERPAAPATTLALRATVRRSTTDRYDAAFSAADPTERATFHLLVPADARLTLRPVDGVVDLTVAELDPGGPLGDALAKGEPGSSRFVARRLERRGTTSDSPPLAEPRVHVAPQRLGEAREPLPPVARIARPVGGKTLVRDGRTYVRPSRPLPVELPRDVAPAVLSLRLFAEQPTDVLVRIDGGRPKRRGSGLATRVTTSRLVHVAGDSTLVFVLGDDLTPGPHEIEIRALAEGEVWVHAPWKRSASPQAPARWLSGGFDP